MLVGARTGHLSISPWNPCRRFFTRVQYWTFFLVIWVGKIHAFEREFHLEHGKDLDDPGRDTPL